MTSKASDFVKGSVDATLKNIPGDAELRRILDSFEEAFASVHSEEEEQRRLKSVNERFLKNDGTTDQVVKEHLDVLPSKANRFIESARKAAFVGARPPLTCSSRTARTTSTSSEGCVRDIR